MAGICRALFIAQKIGIKAAGVASREVPAKYSVKARPREHFVGVLVVCAIHSLGNNRAMPDRATSQI
ncbi:MAG: hypothetical protein ACR2OZ_13475 [Verrucomicrobiales bacterium]